LAGKATTRHVACKRQIHGCDEIVNKGEVIEIVDQFVYLGGKLTNIGDAIDTIEYRLGIARAMFNQMGTIWKSANLNHEIKLELYKVTIIATATHGCATWKFDTYAKRRMNNFNSKCLAFITSKPIHHDT